MSELYLIVSIASRRIAIRGCEVHSVIELEGITPIPKAPPFVAGLAALRSKALTVIDCRRSLELEEDEEETPGNTAVVIEKDDFLYAMLVDRHEDVVHARSELIAEEDGYGDRWDSVALGMIETDLGAALVIDVSGLIAGPEVRRAA